MKCCPRFLPPPPSPRDDRGAALIAVLVLLMTVSLLAMSMAALSQLATLGTRGDADRLRSAYLAEGALNRAIWLTAADRVLYGATNPANVAYEDFDDERFLADGVDREMDYYGVTVRYRILPGAGGVTVTGSSAADALNQLLSVKTASDGDLAEDVRRFSAKVQDYADSNDLLTEDGMEEGDYEEQGMRPLPRNNNIQYREELWWIPDAVRFFPPDRDGRLTLVNPLTLPSTVRQVSLYTANYALLTNYGNLESDDAREVLRTLKEFRRTREPLSETLDPLLWSNLTSRFTTQDNGIFRIVIENALPDSVGGSYRLDATLALPDLRAGGTVTYYDWMRY